MVSKAAEDLAQTEAEEDSTETVVVCFKGEMLVEDSQVAAEATKDFQEMEVVVEDFMPAAAEEDYLEMAEDSLVTAANFLALQAKVLVEAKASVEETHLKINSR